MVLNDITNDSAAKGVGSDTCKNDGTQKKQYIEWHRNRQYNPAIITLNSPVHLSQIVVVVQNGVLWLL
jgi:hypothetical protein